MKSQQIDVLLSEFSNIGPTAFWTKHIGGIRREAPFVINHELHGFVTGILPVKAQGEIIQEITVLKLPMLHAEIIRDIAERDGYFFLPEFINAVINLERNAINSGHLADKNKILRYERIRTTLMHHLSEYSGISLEEVVSEGYRRMCILFGQLINEGYEVLSANIDEFVLHGHHDDIEVIEGGVIEKYDDAVLFSSSKRIYNVSNYVGFDIYEGEDQ